MGYVKLFLFILFSLLLVRVFLFYFFPMQLSNGEKVLFTVTLFEDPKILGSTQEMHVRLGNFWQSIPVVVTAGIDDQLTYGDTLTISGSIKRLLLKNKQVVIAIQNPQIKAKNNGFLPVFGQLRGKIIDFCENNFSQPYSGLLVGIIFGIKSLLTDQVTRSFRITGIAHIVAASGMNVTLVAGFLFTLLGSLVRRRLALLGSLAGILLYTAISGFDPSIVRAALMGSIAFSASYFGRQYDSLYVLFLVAAVMLLWDPLLLVDVGFQLSILATAGILVLKPSLFGSSWVSDDLGTTISAQIATLPILLNTFGQYSLLSLLANLLVLWTIPLITIVGGVGVLVGVFIPFLGKVLVAIIIPLLWYVQNVATFFSANSAIVTISSIPVSITIGYYLLVGSLIFIFRHKKTI